MSPPIEVSQDELRPRNYAPSALPAAATAAPDRDPRTGRFQPGNQVSRRRKLLRIARSLPWLDAEKCEEWARPYVHGTKAHAVELLAELPVQNAMVNPLAEELAAARMVFRGLLALGLAGDGKALEAARAWFREARQHALALEGMARTAAAEPPKPGANGNLPGWFESDDAPASNGGCG